MDDDMYRPYPWWTRIWPLGRIYFAGWQRGEEAGIMRGRFQMGDTQASAPLAAFDMTADTDPALDGDRELIQWLRENAEHLGWEVRELDPASPDSGVSS